MSIPIYVWRKDAEGRFTFVNRWFCQIVGKAAEEVIGKTDFAVFPRDLAEKYRRDDAHVLKTGQTLKVTEENISATGEKLQVEVIKIPICDPRGQVVGTQGIFWDVTAWQRSPRPSAPAPEQAQ